VPFSVQPVTFYVPSSATEPIEVRVSHSGLRMMLVNRESVSLLDDSWAVFGASSSVLSRTTPTAT
jgi:hypothetical protein